MCISGLLLISHWALPYHPALFLHNSHWKSIFHITYTQTVKKVHEWREEEAFKVFFFCRRMLEVMLYFHSKPKSLLTKLVFSSHLISCRLVTSIRDLHCHHVSSTEDRTLPHWKYIQKTQLHKLGVNSVSQSELHLSSGILVPRAVSAQLSNVSNLFLV